MWVLALIILSLWIFHYTLISLLLGDNVVAATNTLHKYLILPLLLLLLLMWAWTSLVYMCAALSITCSTSFFSCCSACRNVRINIDTFTYTYTYDVRVHKYHIFFLRSLWLRVWTVTIADTTRGILIRWVVRSFTRITLSSPLCACVFHSKPLFNSYFYCCLFVF